MINIIIERSMEQMQVVWVFTDVSHEQVRKTANRMEKKWTVNDVDVIEFRNTKELNSRLEQQLKIADKNIDWYIDVLWYRVWYWYNEERDGDINDSDQQHISEQINEWCNQWELCTLWDDDQEHYGRWEIV